MYPKSFGGVRFDLRSFLQGRMWYLIPLMVYISLIIGCRDFGYEDNLRKSCAPNLLMGSDLTLDPSSRSNVVLDTYDGLYLPITRHL